MTNTDQALELVRDGMTLGLGSGSAAERFIVALGERVRAGLTVRGIATSRRSAEVAATAGIPLVELGDALPLDLTFDGADEVDPQLNLIKGYGHALVREKVVAAASAKLVILIGPANVGEKLVTTLGQRGKLPVEVVPFAVPLVVREVGRRYGFAATPVLDAGGPFLSDNGNHLLELAVPPLGDPAGLERELRAIPGVVGTGLFLGMASAVIVERDGTAEVRQRPPV